MFVRLSIILSNLSCHVVYTKQTNEKLTCNCTKSPRNCNTSCRINTRCYSAVLRVALGVDEGDRASPRQ